MPRAPGDPRADNPIIQDGSQSREPVEPLETHTGGALPKNEFLIVFKIKNMFLIVFNTKKNENTIKTLVFNRFVIVFVLKIIETNIFNIKNN